MSNEDLVVELEGAFQKMLDDAVKAVSLNFNKLANDHRAEYLRITESLREEIAELNRRFRSVVAAADQRTGDAEEETEVTKRRLAEEIHGLLERLVGSD